VRISNKRNAFGVADIVDLDGWMQGALRKVEDAVSQYHVELPKVFLLRWCLLEYRIVEVGGGQHLNASLSRCDLGGWKVRVHFDFCCQAINIKSVLQDFQGPGYLATLEQIGIIVRMQACSHGRLPQPCKLLPRRKGTFHSMRRG
jgi:hypothetical protein